MDREKFDDILKDKIQESDQKYSPAFNDKKVWKAIKKPGNRNRWFQIAATSAIVILGLSFLFQQYVEPVAVGKLEKPAISGGVFQIPEGKTRDTEKVYKSEKAKSMTLTAAPKPHYELNDTSLSTVAIPASENILRTADSNQTQTVKIIEPVRININELPLAAKDVEGEIKVTFKRGRVVRAELPLESKLSFRKFKLRIFENQTYDTSAYASGAKVEADRKFRIKF